MASTLVRAALGSRTSVSVAAQAAKIAAANGRRYSYSKAGGEQQGFWSTENKIKAIFSFGFGFGIVAMTDGQNSRHLTGMELVAGNAIMIGLNGHPFYSEGAEDE